MHQQFSKYSWKKGYWKFPTMGVNMLILICCFVFTKLKLFGFKYQQCAQPSLTFWKQLIIGYLLCLAALVPPSGLVAVQCPQTSPYTDTRELKVSL